MLISIRTLEGRKALGLSAILNLPFGLWPLENDSAFLRIRWTLSMLIMMILLLQGIYETYLDCVHTENNADNLYSITFGATGLTKLLVYFIHRDKLRLNVESAIQDWLPKSPKNASLVVMSTYRSVYDKIAQSLLVIGTFAASMFCAKIFFIDPDSTIEVKSYEGKRCVNVTTLLKKRFLLPAACTFNESSQFLYWSIVATQLVQFATNVGVNLSCDTFFIAVTYHLCGQLEILKIRFGKFRRLYSIHETRRQFRFLVRRHRHLLKLADLLETTFNLVMFCQMVMNLLILNVAGFNFLVLVKKGATLSAMSNASVMMFALVQTFMYSYIGDMLTSQGADIARSVYESQWYTMPMRFSKDIIFVMVQTNLSIGFTAGKFFKMTRGTFTDIVKTAVSYLSVLRILIEEKRI